MEEKEKFHPADIGRGKKTKNGKTKKFLTYAGVVALILAAVIISLLFYRQKIEITRDVFKNLTEDWQTFESDKYRFSFKYPKEWKIGDMAGKIVEDPSIDYIIQDSEKKDQNEIRLRVFGLRSVDTRNPEDAIQISIPFDKQNYLIFSTSTSNKEKEVFYNIPATLEFKK